MNGRIDSGTETAGIVPKTGTAAKQKTIWLKPTLSPHPKHTRIRWKPKYQALLVEQEAERRKAALWAWFVFFLGLSLGACLGVWATWLG